MVSGFAGAFYKAFSPNSLRYFTKHRKEVTILFNKGLISMETRKIYAFTPVVLLAILLFSSCRELLTVKRDFEAKEISFDLPAIPVSGPFEFTQPAPSNLAAEIEQLDIPLVEVTGLTIRKVVITMVDTSKVGSAASFDVLDNLYLYINSPEVAESRIAFKDPVPRSNSQVLEMDVDQSVNLLQYAKASSISYRVKGQSNSRTNNPIKLSIKITFRVTAEVL